jgi:hypothetical protein
MSNAFIGISATVFYFQPETFEEVAARHKDVNPFLLHKWDRIFNAFFGQSYIFLIL